MHCLNAVPVTQARTSAAGENQNGGDGEIGKNVTMLMSVSWDFTAPDDIRDRNTGIWRDVELYTTRMLPWPMLTSVPNYLCPTPFRLSKPFRLKLKTIPGHVKRDLTGTIRIMKDCKNNFCILIICYRFVMSDNMI